MADWLTGLVQGFAGRKAEIEQENLAEAQRMRQREGAVLQSLINSPDPEVKHLAIAGLLDSASPAKRKSGLAGWIGQTEQSPWLSRIQALSPTVRKTGTLADVPTQQGYLPDPPPALGSAAMPTTSPTVQGPDGAPLSEVQPITENVTVVGTPPPRETIGLSPDVRNQDPAAARGTLSYQYESPRQYFPSAADLALETARAKAQGDVEGDVAGLVASGVPEDEARATVQQHLRGRMSGATASPYQAVAVEYLDPSQNRWISDYATYDKRTGRWLGSTGTPLPGAVRQVPKTAQHTMGIAFERAARELGYANGTSVPAGPEAEAVNARAVQLLQDEATARTYGQGIGRFQAPMTADQALRAGAPVGTTSQQLVGQAIPTQQQRDARIGIRQVSDGIRTQILPLLNVLPSQRDFGGTIAPGAIFAARRRSAEWQPRIAQLESALASVKSNLTRIQGERGALSDQDIARVNNALIVLNAGLDNFFGADNAESAAARLNQTLQSLDLVAANLPATPVPQGPGAAVGAPPPGASRGVTPPPAGGRTTLDTPIPGMVIRDGKFFIP